ncbi:MAG: tetratricopeptide repeat protein [Sporomusaceae bacterium]|nr:tetratricopeptide repeat protein [Sporomusaceae bacterium]
MLKIRLSIAVLLCLIVSLITSIAAAESPDRAKEMVAMTQQKMALAKNYHMIMAIDMAMNTQGKNMNSTINIDMDIFSNPLLAKNKTDILFSVSDKEKLIQRSQTHMTLLQYMEQSGPKILIYTYTDGKWHKQSSLIGSVTPNKEYENFLKQVKSARITSEDQDTIVIEAVMDGKFIKETLQNNASTVGLAKMNLKDDFISSIGDVTYTITIDKKSMTLSRVDMDLSDFMQRFGGKLAEGSTIPTEKKQQLKDLFSNMQMHMTMTMSKYDEIESFTIPDEAKLAVEDQPAVNPNDKVIHDLTNIINHNPNDFVAYAKRGEAYSNKKNFDLALNDFNKAIELNPKYAFAYAWRGYILAKMSKGDSAIADYSKAIEIDPDYAYAYQNRGLEYAKKKQLDIAITDYNKAIELNPKYKQAYFNRGIAYEQKQLYQEAIDNYRSLIVNIPDDKAAVELAKTRIRALGGTV